MPSAASPRHFYMRPRMQVVFLVLFVVAPVALGVWLETDASVPRGSGWMAAITFIAIGQVIYLPLFWYQRVIVSAEGLRCRAVMTLLSVPWEGIERFYRGRDGHFGFVTKAPMPRKESDRWSSFAAGGRGFRFDEAERGWYDDDRYLPLTVFGAAVRSGTLQRDVARYVPALPGLDAGELLVPAAERSTIRRGVVLVLALTAAWLVAALLIIAKLFPDIDGRTNWKLPLVLFAGGSLQSAVFAGASWMRRRRYWTLVNGAMAVILALFALTVWYSPAR